MDRDFCGWLFDRSGRDIVCGKILITMVIADGAYHSVAALFRIHAPTDFSDRRFIFVFWSSQSGVNNIVSDSFKIADGEWERNRGLI